MWETYEEAPPIHPGTLGAVLGMIRGWELKKALVAELGRAPGGSWCDTVELARFFNASTGRVRKSLAELEEARVLWRDGDRSRWVEVAPDPTRWLKVPWRIAHPVDGVRHELRSRLERVWLPVDESELLAAQRRFIARPRAARCAGASARLWPRDGAIFGAANARSWPRDSGPDGWPDRAVRPRVSEPIPLRPRRALLGGAPGKRGSFSSAFPGTASDPVVGFAAEGRATATVSMELRNEWRARFGLPAAPVGKLLEAVGELVERFGEPAIVGALAGEIPPKVRGKAHVMDGPSWVAAQLLPAPSTRPTPSVPERAPEPGEPPAPMPDGLRRSARTMAGEDPGPVAESGDGDATGERASEAS